MGEGCEALHVNSEQARERVGLGVTELRELCGDVPNGAVPLAQLHAGQGRALSDRSGGGGEAVGGQGRRKDLNALGDALSCLAELHGKTLLELSGALTRKVAHGILARMLGKETQRRDGDVVVVAAHAIVAGFGKDVCARGSAATTHPPQRTGGRRLALLDSALFGKQVEVATNGRWSQAKTRGERCGGDRPEL